MADTRETALRLMTDLQSDYGLSAEQAAGVVGNFMHESGGFNSMQEISPLVPGARGGYGYAQWTGPRRNAFEDFVGANNLDPASYEANYGFLQHELANDPYESNQFFKVRSAKTAEEAARLVSENYLRPGIPHMDSRIEYANQVLGYAPGQQPSPAVAAINTAAPSGYPTVMRGPAPKGGGFWSPFLAPVKTAMANFGAPIVRAASSPQVQRAAVGPMLGSVAGRTTIMRSMMNRNIGPAPTIMRASSGPGTRALAVNNQGTTPVMLASRQSSNNGNDDSNPSGMDMGVYRANAAVLGGGGFTQDNINKALSSGKTLYKLA